MLFRDATRQDFIDFYGRPPPFTITGIVAERDGALVGFAGWYSHGDCICAFTDHKGMTKREMIRAGKEVMRMLMRPGRDVIAIPQPEHGTVALRHWGFSSLGDTGLYRWAP